MYLPTPDTLEACALVVEEFAKADGLMREITRSRQRTQPYVAVTPRERGNGLARRIQSLKSVSRDQSDDWLVNLPWQEPSFCTLKNCLNRALP